MQDVPVGNYWLAVDFFTGEKPKSNANKEPIDTNSTIFSKDALSIVQSIEFISLDYELSTEENLTTDESELVTAGHHIDYPQ